MIENSWYVGCASSQLTEDAPLGTCIGDHNIVLFRDAVGGAAALLDRCCHRGFPLSRSRMSGGLVQCGYHGWEYDREGRCVRIPSMPPDRSIPPHYRVPRYHCLERDHFVWVWVGTDEPTEPPCIPEAGIGRWVQGARSIRCNYVSALEITFDLFHVYFVHPSMAVSMRAREHGFVDTVYEMRSTDGGCVVFAPPVEEEVDEIPPSAFRMEFRLPGTIHYAIPRGGKLHHMYFHVTPTGDDSCRMNWLVDDAAPTHDADPVRWIGDDGVFGEEDRRILEAVQNTHEREGTAFERSVEADVPSLTLRKIVRAAEAGVRQGAGAGKRRLLTLASARSAAG